MKNEAIKIFQKKRKSVLESWVKFQLADETLREDLMTNEDLRGQSEELLNTIIDSLTDDSLTKIDSNDIEPVNEMLTTISTARAKQGFTPRETGAYVLRG